jgi:hypothetical protein
MTLLSLLSLLFSLILAPVPVTWALESSSQSFVDVANPAALQEVTRVLAEEVKLAARPQTYVLIDLTANTILLKSHGVELHRIPIKRWTASDQGELVTTFRLQERPPVTRRKIDPSVSPEQDPISLADMPTAYSLRFTPALTITIDSYDHANLWRLVAYYIRQGWKLLVNWWHAIWAGDTSSTTLRLDLTVSVDDAQSLAWMATEGMPVLIRRPAQ